MKQALRKLHKTGGFTLTELMATMVILLLVAGIVAAGIPAAARAYVKVVDAANAQVLLSTTMTVLRDELGQATKVNVASATTGEGDGAVTEYTITYRGGNTGSETVLENGTNGIVIREYLDDAFDPTDGMSDEMKEAIENARNGRPLVTAAAAGRLRSSDSLRTSFGRVDYADGLFTIHDLTVWKDGLEAAKMEQYQIRAVAAAIK